MRALTRMRLLAAVCALLLLMLAPIATANVPGRPIDRPDGPPDPDPTMVGDPDTGNNGLWEYVRQAIIASQLGNQYLRSFALHFVSDGRRHAWLAAHDVRRR